MNIVTIIFIIVLDDDLYISLMKSGFGCNLGIVLTNH